MSKKNVKYIYQGKEYLESCDKAAERILKDRTEEELNCFASFNKHSPKGQKRYLGRDPKDLYPSNLSNGRIKKAKEILNGWFIPPNIGPKTLSIIFGLVCKCSDLDYGRDLVGPEWD